MITAECTAQYTEGNTPGSQGQLAVPTGAECQCAVEHGGVPVWCRGVTMFSGLLPLSMYTYTYIVWNLSTMVEKSEVDIHDIPLTNHGTFEPP